MPQPRIPTSLLDARGAFKKHPERRRAREAEPVEIEAIGRPPSRLSKEEKKAWKEIVGQCPEGVLKKSNRLALEEAARLTAKSWTGTLSLEGRRLLKSYIVAFGMTPADRSRVSSPKQAPANRFSKTA